METQKQVVIEELLKNGRVTRNWALRKFISRLGAIVDTLKRDGYEFEGFYEEYINAVGYKSKDYVYRLLKKPELRLFK